VLGSSAQRSPSAPYASRNSAAVRRRVVATLLVLVSLALLTAYFRESSSGAVHSLQNAGASALRPFEVAGERVARPFRDLAGWAGGLTHARSDNKKLRAEINKLREQVLANESALQENAQLKQLLKFREGPSFPKDFRAVAVRVIGRAPSQFQQEIQVDAGSSSGIALHDAVVTADGLVGQVTRVASTAARVTLLTDETSAVSALDVQSRAAGVLRHGTAASSTLVLDRVPKEQVVNQGDPIVTAGWHSAGLSSLYPKGIPIGAVLSASQNDIDFYKQVQVQPYVDFGSLEAVLVLVPKPKPAR
jgi:rod shape-determining protein MreC